MPLNQGLPKQLLKESEKDEVWRMHCVRSIVEMVDVSNWTKLKDRFCYDFYAGIINESDYNYLTKVGDYEFPAKVRFIPLIRTRLDELRSEETKRPFSYRTFTVDTQSIKRKEDLFAKAVIDKLRANVYKKYQGVTSMLAQLQQIQAKMQEQQQNPQEGQQSQQIDPNQAMMIQSQLDTLQRESLLTKDELDGIEKYYKYTYKDFLEILADKGLAYMLAKYNIKDMFSDGFTDKLITDKEIFCVDWDGFTPDPEFRRVNNLLFWHSGDDSSQWIDECEWGMEVQYMTLNQVIDFFKYDLSPEQTEKLLKNSRMYDSTEYNGYYGYGDQYSSVDNSTEKCQPNSLYSGTENYASRIRVARCCWKSPRELKFKKSPSKYNPDLSYTHLMKEDDKIDSSKGDTMEPRYTTDVYEGFCIDRDIFIRLRKKPFVDRSIDKHGKVHLPWVGVAFNNVIKKPYSLVWATKDIQILYNLVHYHKELWIALSGVKGFIMDKAQIPTGMSPKEWLYQRKIGVGWIESIKEGQNRQPTFNQFQQYDDTVTPAITYLINILQHLEELAGSVTGVSRQRLGMTQPQDQVQTTQSSINQSSMVTEIIFHEHERIKRRALGRLVNLFKLCWKKGKRGHSIFGDLGQEILNIPANVFDNADFELFIPDSGKQERTMQDLKAAAQAQFSKNVFSLSQLTKIYSTDGLKELEKTLERYDEMAEMKASNNQQAAFKNEQDKIKMENEYKLIASKQAMELGSIQENLKKITLDWEKEKFGMEQDLKKQEIDIMNREKNLEISSKREIELLYLQEQKRAANTQESLQKEELQVEKANVSINHAADERRHTEKISKMKEQAKKVRVGLNPKG